jgi:hypothetical protein
MQRVRAREQRHFEKYGKREVVASDDSLEYFRDLPLSNIIRPQGDVTTLTRLGFHVSTEEDIGRTVYEAWEKELYGESPLFEICAIKGGMSEEKARVKNYWQKRSSTFGFSLEADSLNAWGGRIRKHLPEGPLKVLDAGTGTGFMAAVMASLGHEVTGVDLCSRMIERARENAKAEGLRINFLCTDAGELPFEDGAFDSGFFA